MGLIQNDSDIILDCCLTDTGRMRLSKANSSFKIVKFCLGDDEINYADYNTNHPSGSSYADLTIMSTPVFEAFTNNGSSMKSKLITIPRLNLLYLPSIKINEFVTKPSTTIASGSFVVAVDKDTEDNLPTTDTGVLLGENPGSGTPHIRLDQGLDTTEISYRVALDPDLEETQFIIEMDNRLGKIIDKSGNLATVSYLDDDSIASYFFSRGNDNNFVTKNTENSTSTNQIIAGPRGAILEFKVLSSLDLNTSTYLFTTLGNSTTVSAKTYRYIDSVIKVMGGTTGYSVSIPVRYMKYYV